MRTTATPIDSYLVLIDNTVICFNAHNTPIENFCGGWELRHYNLEKGFYEWCYTVNGQIVTKDYIKEIHFGESYNNAAMIGHHFMDACEELTEVDLSGLRSIHHIGNFFLTCCKKLTDVNFSQLTNLKSKGGNFLAGCWEYKPAAPVMDWLDSLEYDGAWCI